MGTRETGSDHPGGSEPARLLEADHREMEGAESTGDSRALEGYSGCLDGESEWQLGKAGWLAWSVNHAAEEKREEFAISNAMWMWFTAESERIARHEALLRVIDTSAEIGGS